MIGLAPTSKLHRLLVPLVLSATALAVPPASGGEESEPPIPGFSRQSAQIQRAIEDKLVQQLDPASTAGHFRIFTAKPHPAGSKKNYELALYTRNRFHEYGLEEVELHEYEVYLPWPNEVRVEMLEPHHYVPTLKEDAFPEDKQSSADVGPTYLGMSGSGDVTAEVIYAHSGNPEDYDWLESQGIDPKGKIAIVRYSVPYSYRGFKAWEAERRGVKALLIYSDPMEDGYSKGVVFPDGPWGPSSHIQRGAITYDFIVPGDPLTPGWPSALGARRIPIEEARSAPEIIAVPLSWRDARPILESLGGPVAPEAWQGALPITYHVGPGPAKLRVKVEMDGKSRSIWVVTGKILGSEEPDKMVILGNHRDAWVYGGVDPSSGTASQLEAARILGNLRRQGHRPKRTLVLANWDAEEDHLTGSTEWGEQFARELAAGAIAYLNVDSSVSGPDFDVGAVASLNPSILAVARDVMDPYSRRSLLETWRARIEADTEKGESPTLIENNLGSGSDYTVFLNYLGVPIVDMSFDGPYGVYHSQYDNLYWMEKFGDPGFRYMTAMVDVWSRLALRLANADILPYNFGSYAKTVAGFLDTLGEQPEVSANLDLSPARKAVIAWGELAERFDGAVESELRDGDLSPERLTAVNNALLQVERQFLAAEGIPDRPWFKHVLYAPRYTYAAMSLPGIQEAVEAGDWDRARRQVQLLTQRLEAATASLEAASQTLIQISQ
jgi:N-acetylated-alpha-linked acidic dipeptidase